MPLTIAASPIGNALDASARLTSALAAADVIAAEDTRRLRRLATDLGVTMKGRVVSLFEGNEARRTQDLVALLLAGSEVVLVSDAGTPTVSDPGLRLVQECAARNIPMRVLPGPSAVLAALAVSGLPTDRFCFEGFLPRKAGERRRRLAALAGEHRTMVCFESPRRVGTSLADMATAFGPERPAVVCRELTKTHEEVKRGGLGDLADWAAGGLLGEVTIVVSGAPDTPAEVADGELCQRVADLIAAGASRRDAIDTVSRESGIARKRVYAAAHGEARPPLN